MKNWLKAKWKAVISLFVVPAAFAAGTQVAPRQEGFDDKGLENVRVQVLIKEPNYQDAVYYTPEEWAVKTAPEIENEKAERLQRWQALVDEQSRKEAPVEEIKEEPINETAVEN